MGWRLCLKATYMLAKFRHSLCRASLELLLEEVDTFWHRRRRLGVVCGVDRESGGTGADGVVVLQAAVRTNLLQSAR